ncbi:unnamed protein product [Closterium sp. NIES-65]|nr:unnamed protein product [Closterium sp. NIES-65]
MLHTPRSSPLPAPPASVGGIRGQASIARYTPECLAGRTAACDLSSAHSSLLWPSLILHYTPSFFPLPSAAHQRVWYSRLPVRVISVGRRHGSQGTQLLVKHHGLSLSLPLPHLPQPNTPPRSHPVSPPSQRRLPRRLPVRVISVGRHRSQGTQLLVKDCAEKISRYCPFEDLSVRSNPKGTSDVRVQVEAEGEKVLKALHRDDWVVLLDERGRTVTSEQLAQLIADCADASHRSLTFVVGGPYGHGSQVKARANSSIRLSSLVLNHEVALVVLAEQLYRAWTILKGEKYHH